MADRTLTVRIIGDSKSLERAFDRSQTKAKGFQAQVVGVNRGLGRLGVATGATIGLAAFFDQARRSTQAASNLNEQINKSNVVFGQSAASVLSWSKTTADAFGVSQRAALEAASGFGQILETSGLNQKRAAQMSRSLVELAADIASFNNIDPTEALDKLRSGLAGEAEPLRRVGVLLSEARVKQEAYTSGIAKQGAKLTEGQKVQARYNLILKDTATAQGDFARTSDSLANKQRKLSANVEELQARLGRDLVPVLSTVIDLLLSAESAASKFAAALNRLPGGTSFRLKDLFGSGIKASDIEELKRQSNLLDAAERGGGLDQRLERAAKAASDLEKAGRKVPASLRNTIFDQTIAREVFRSADKSLTEQIAVLDRIEAQLVAEIARVKDITRKENLRDQLITANRQERALREQIAQNNLAAQQLAADKRREALEQERARIAARIAANKARQFRALGLTATGEEPVAGVGALTRRLGTLRDQVKGTALDTEKTRAQLKRIGKVLSGQFGAVGRDVRSAIQRMFSDINDALKNGTGRTGPLTKASVVNADAILAGLGLSADQMRAARARLAKLTTSGQLTAVGGVGAFGRPISGISGGAMVISGPITVVSNDPDDFKKKLQKKARRTATQTTGPSAGNSMGFVR